MVLLNDVIPWEEFRPLLKKIRKTNDAGRGRPAFDEIVMLKVLVLQALNNVSDDRMEFLLKDRLSFMRFLGMKNERSVFPDAKTIWLFKEKLREAELMPKIFYWFNKYLKKNGFTVSEGTILDATIIEVPKQRNTKEETARIKQGEIPSEWETDPNKMYQKDTDARWTKKGNRSYYGYKNHIAIDPKSKLIKDYHVTSANVYDGIAGLELLKNRKQGTKLYPDSAYRNCNEFMKKLKKKNLVDKICFKEYRNKPLKEKYKKLNTKIARIRGRIEHVFGDMKSFSGKMIRTIGMERAKFQIGFINLVFNFRRFAFYQS
ncbi:IS5 family transposase [Leptospira santarosai]|nr:IS5 family transposase [Leptospira santarosai]OLY60364.1 IS5 family transposase [Leptospira santarosai serovar Guaricura]ASV10795.1 IS5/IS1182 family transposase [Leptospira santarosai]MDI7174413.1 IS5 family transposase [Leptospira santarosai]MDI7193746.1 IS5 family transposase [Leptospira santarosai]MDO6382090.1 IS5 family transposase [Leptospira santarosai]